MTEYVCGAYKTERGIVVPKTPFRDSIVKARKDAYAICKRSTRYSRHVPIHRIGNGEFIKVVGEVYSPGPDMILWRIPHPNPKKWHVSLGIWNLNPDGTLGKKWGA